MWVAASDNNYFSMITTINRNSDRVIVDLETANNVDLEKPIKICAWLQNGG